MSKASSIFFLVILLGGGGYYFYHTQLSSSFLDKKKITIAGEEYDVRPKESLKEIGCSLRRIPNVRNAAVLYVKASNLYEKPEGSERDVMNYVCGHEWVSDADFTRWFERNAECLKALHKAAKKPDCEFPVVGHEKEMAAARMDPMLPVSRDFVRLLVCEGKRYESRREYGRALDSYLAIAALCEHLHDSNAVLITDLVVIACHATGNKAAEACLANKSLSEKDLRKVVQRYERVLKTHAALSDVLEREKCMMDDAVNSAMNAPEHAWMVTVGLGSVSDETRSNIARLVREQGPRLKAAYERDFEAFRKWSALPAWQALRPGSDWEAYVSRLPETSIFSRSLLNTFGMAKQQYARNEAHAGGILIFAAIKLYEKKNGKPPASFNDLVPGCLAALPKDPFSGKDYIYKVRGSDWILYSVWDDLVDGGGAGSWPHNRKKDKDLVFWSKKIPVEPRPQ